MRWAMTRAEYEARVLHAWKECAKKIEEADSEYERSLRSSIQMATRERINCYVSQRQNKIPSDGKKTTICNSISGA